MVEPMAGQPTVELMAAAPGPRRSRGQVIEEELAASQPKGALEGLLRAQSWKERKAAEDDDELFDWNDLQEEQFQHDNMQNNIRLGSKAMMFMCAVVVAIRIGKSGHLVDLSEEVEGEDRYKPCTRADEFRPPPSLRLAALSVEVGLQCISFPVFFRLSRRPRVWPYLLLLSFWFAYLLVYNISPLTASCMEREACGRSFDQDEEAANMFHWDCGMHGHSIMQAMMSFLFLSPRIIPTEKMMHIFIWTWIFGLYLPISIVYHYKWRHQRGPLKGQPYHSTFDLISCVVLLSAVAAYAISKKFYLAKGQRSKFIYDLKKMEVSEKMFHILAYMVPEHVVVRMLRNPEGVIAEPLARVSILFVVFVDFEHTARKLSPEQLLGFLNRHFSNFDKICAAYDVLKIETVSEEYVCAVGVTPRDASIDQDESRGHPEILGQLVRVAWEMLQLHDTVDAEADSRISLKMGCHTGAVVAGVIGHKLPRFRLFGDTINTAARMMQKGVEGQLQFGEETRRHLPDWVPYTRRGEIEMKGKGHVMAYLLDRNNLREPHSMLVEGSAAKKKPSILVTLMAEGADGTGSTSAARSSQLVRTSSRGRQTTSGAPRIVEVELTNMDGAASSRSRPPSAAPPSPRGRGEMAVGLLDAPRATSKTTAAMTSSLSEAPAKDSGETGMFAMMTSAWSSAPSDGVAQRLSDRNALLARFRNMTRDRDRGEPEHSSAGGAKHFGRVLEQVNLSESHAEHDGWSLKALGPGWQDFPPELEDEFRMWFHKEAVCKKLEARLDKQALAISVVTVFEMGLTVLLTGAFHVDHPIYGENLRFPVFLVCRFSSYVVIMAWRAVASANDWIMEAAVDAQRRITLSAWVIDVLFFLSYDTMLLNPRVAIRQAETVDDRRMYPQDSHIFSLVFVLLYAVITTQNPMLFLHTCSFMILACIFWLLAKPPWETPNWENIFLNDSIFLFLMNNVLYAIIAHDQERSLRSRFLASHAMESTHNRIQKILVTLMPPMVVEDLRKWPSHLPPPSHHYREATVAQSDLVGFTQLASRRRPEEVVKFVGELFGMFDDLLDSFGVYKVETVGDAYIAAMAEPPLTKDNSPIDVLLFGLEMVRATHEWSRKIGEGVSCRVGVHSGECVGGIVGMEMQRYHLFGNLMTCMDTLEATSVEGRVQISGACKEAVEQQILKQGVRVEPANVVDIFEPRTEKELRTSKGEVHEYSEVGGPTFLVTRHLRRI